MISFCYSFSGRVSIVDYDGNVLLDMYSQPNEPITDYRTPWSGLRESDLKNANPYDITIQMVKSIIKVCAMYNLEFSSDENCGLYVM